MGFDLILIDLGVLRDGWVWDTDGRIDINGVFTHVETAMSDGCSSGFSTDPVLNEGVGGLC